MSYLKHTHVVYCPQFCAHCIFNKIKHCDIHKLFRQILIYLSTNSLIFIFLSFLSMSSIPIRMTTEVEFYFKIQIVFNAKVFEI
jgi:hypothetical protein